MSNSTPQFVPVMLTNKLTTTEVYGYSTLAVVVISLVSLVGALVVPLIGRKCYQYTMIFFMSMAIGTLCADALLHLLPMALKIHDDHVVNVYTNESLNSSAGNHTEQHPHNLDYLWKCSTVLAALYVLYLFEFVATMVNGRMSPSTSGEIEKNTTHKHGHSHNFPLAKIHPNNSPMPTYNTMATDERQSTDGDVKPAVVPIIGGSTKSSMFTCGLKPIAFMIMVGDAVHNFADGMVVGAAFTAGTTTGLSTTIAIFCHELPHEIGDFAVLIASGLSVKVALLLNLASSVAALLGLYIGIVVANDNSVQYWIFAVVAGVFLYVALVNMVSEIKQIEDVPPVYNFILQNLGLWIGYVILLLIAIFEDEIKF